MNSVHNEERQEQEVLLPSPTVKERRKISWTRKLITGILLALLVYLLCCLILFPSLVERNARNTHIVLERIQVLPASNHSILPITVEYTLHSKSICKVCVKQFTAQLYHDKYLLGTMKLPSILLENTGSGSFRLNQTLHIIDEVKFQDAVQKLFDPNMQYVPFQLVGYPQIYPFCALVTIVPPLYRLAVPFTIQGLASFLSEPVVVDKFDILIADPQKLILELDALITSATKLSIILDSVVFEACYLSSFDDPTACQVFGTAIVDRMQLEKGINSLHVKVIVKADSLQQLLPVISNYLGSSHSLFLLRAIGDSNAHLISRTIPTIKGILSGMDQQDGGFIQSVELRPAAKFPFAPQAYLVARNCFNKPITILKLSNFTASHDGNPIGLIASQVFDPPQVIPPKTLWIAKTGISFSLAGSLATKLKLARRLIKNRETIYVSINGSAQILIDQFPIEKLPITQENIAVKYIGSKQLSLLITVPPEQKAPL